MSKRRRQITGIEAALSSAFFLGLAPVFGKQAMTLGFTFLEVVALRTSMAAILLLLIVAVFRRSFLFIYPAGLLGCALAGTLNGLGSLLYYYALGRLSVSVGQLLYSLYPLFLVVWMIIDRQPPSRLTFLRIGIAIIGIIFLTIPNTVHIDWLGVAMMLGASVMYAIHLPINQRVLYDIPAPTVTLYTLLSMSLIVVPAYFLFDRQLPSSGTSWLPILALALVTFLSRLMLFMGVKNLGGIQTALLGLGELFVSITVGHFWLHESLTLSQWVGAAFLALSLILVSLDKAKPENRRHNGLLAWVRLPEISPGISWNPRD